MDTNTTLTAEQIAEACETYSGSLNRQAIEDAYELQTPPDILMRAIARADAWPKCRNTPAGSYGLPYAYLLEFLICNEKTRVRMGDVTWPA